MNWTHVLGAAVFGFVIGGSTASVMWKHSVPYGDCKDALLEACKRDGGNRLDGLKCVKVEDVK